MTDFLGVEVNANALNAYASQAREDHRISLTRAIALMVATGDTRLATLDLRGGRTSSRCPMRLYATSTEAAATRHLIREKRRQLDAQLLSLREAEE